MGCREVRLSEVGGVSMCAEVEVGIPELVSG